MRKVKERVLTFLWDSISVYCPPKILRTAVIVALVLRVLGVSAPLAVFAVSYVPAPLYHRHEIEAPMHIGDEVYLFHSGTDDVKRAIHPSDILTVYRISPSCQVTTVGRIKVISYVEETYLKGVVIEGEIKPYDVAKKGNVSCLVILAGPCGSGQ
jgi:hypothetical protein